MKLATFMVRETATWGMIEGESVFDLGSVLGDRFPDLKSLIAQRGYGDAQEARASAPRYAVEDVDWLPVVPNPEKIFCVGLNYEMHRKETGRAEVAHPTIFIRFANTQTGHLTTIVRPRVSTQLDFEGELALIIGKHGRSISRDRAFDHIAGYACYNDGSVRDWQHHTHQFTPGKNFPRTGSFGPWMVTADEVPAGGKGLKIQTRLNGQTLQSDNTDNMMFPVAEMLVYITQGITLEPGDIIITGTPSGVGFARKPPIFMRGGDTAEVDIEGVGVLVNPIVDEK